ncbi:TRAP transporter small permease subunit [Lachnospiraceae bacterium 62-35]
MKAIEKIVRVISKSMFHVSCVLVLALIGIICTDVVARYAFNHPIAWVYEMSYILGAFVAATGIAQLMLDGGNIRVDMFYAKFSNKIKLLVDIAFGIGLFLPCYIALTWAVIKNCITAYVTGEESVITTWYPKLWPIKLMLCIGLILFLITYVLITIEKIGEFIKEIKKGGKS